MMTAYPTSDQAATAVRQVSNRPLGRAVGQEIRALRRDRHLTVSELAHTAGLSASLISKIEHGFATPSLTTLQLLGDALSSPVAKFFQGFDKKCCAHFVKSTGDGSGEATVGLPGLSLLNLGRVDLNMAGATVEASLVTMTDVPLPPALECRPGIKLIYMFAGSVSYRHGDKIYALQKGDSLMFRADEPHGPEALTGPVASYLAYAASVSGEASGLQSPQSGQLLRVEAGLSDV
jgi:DNA-binding XRE family transcriptional regulator